MSARTGIGIVVAQGYVRVAAVRGAEIEWLLDTELDDPFDPRMALHELLDQAPSRALRNSPVGVAIAGPLAQLRIVRGLPAEVDERAASALVAGSPHRWFLTRPGGLVTSSVLLAQDGSRVAVAYPRSTLDGLRLTLESRGLHPRFVTIESAVGCEEHGVSQSGVGGTDPMFEWHRGEDGSIALGSSTDQPDPAESPAAPRPATHQPFRPPEFSSAVRVAALAASGLAGPFTVTSFARPVTTVPPRRARAALGTAAVALLLLIAARPGATAITSVRLSQAERRALASSPADSMARAVSDAEAELASLAARAASRQSVIALLEEIRRVLPSDVAITSFRVDSAQGILSVLGSRVGTVPDQLAELPVLRAPRLVGPVTSESTGLAVVERATIAFDLPPTADPG